MRQRRAGSDDEPNEGRTWEPTSRSVSTTSCRPATPSATALHRDHLNPQLPRMLHAIGFDRNYVRGEGAYLYDDEGRDYLDMLAGFGVFALGRHHPVVRQAMHDVLDAGLADLTQFDAPVLAGPLAAALLAKAPHLDRVYFGNSGTEAVEAALKFARYYTGRSRVLYFAQRLPRAHRGVAVGQRRQGLPQGLRPDAARQGAALGRSRGARTRAAARRRRGAARRTGAGQGRGRRAAGLPRRGAPAAQGLQGAAHRRRGAVRAGPHRRVVRLPARRRRARPRRGGQGAVRRVRARRRDARPRRDLPQGLLEHGPRARPRLDVRLQRAGHGRRAGHDARARARGRRRERPRRRRRAQAPARGARAALRDAARGPRPRADDRHRVRRRRSRRGRRARTTGRCSWPARDCSRRPSCTRCSTGTAS